MAQVEPDAIRREEQRNPTCNSRCKVKKMIKRWSCSNLASRTSSTTTLPANSADTARSPIQIPRISTPIPEGQFAMSEKGACEDEKHTTKENTSPESDVKRATELGTATSRLTEDKSPALESKSSLPEEMKTQPPPQAVGSTETKAPDPTQPPTSTSPPTSNQPTPTTSTPAPLPLTPSPPLQSAASEPSLRTHKSKPSIHIPPISPSPDTRSAPSTAHKHTSSAQSDIEKAALALVLPKSTITTTITAAAGPQDSVGKRRSLVRKSSMKWWMVERWVRRGVEDRGGKGGRVERG